ncbi:MAG: hypothetical protein J0H40_17195 [Rhizobiales bacterium]|nr:hypothetical protein [Hyphomicrobiales bacterium]
MTTLLVVTLMVLVLLMAVRPVVPLMMRSPDAEPPALELPMKLKSWPDAWRLEMLTRQSVNFAPHSDDVT